MLWLAWGPTTNEPRWLQLAMLCPNPGGQLKLKPGMALCLPSIPCVKLPPLLRRTACLWDFQIQIWIRAISFSSFSHHLREEKGQKWLIPIVSADFCLVLQFLVTECVAACIVGCVQIIFWHLTGKHRNRFTFSNRRSNFLILYFLCYS